MEPVYADPDIWTIADRVMQWLILPGLAAIWWLVQRQNTSEREILRILTILEERNERRLEDRARSDEAVDRLQYSIMTLSEKLDRFIEAAPQRAHLDPIVEMSERLIKKLDEKS